MKGSKVKQKDKGVFETETTLDTFGRKVDLGDGEVQELETQSLQQLVDDATGKQIILRCFDFALVDMEEKPSKQEVLNAHAHLIRTHLWKDGLVAIEDIDPRIKFHDKGFHIFVACQPRLGQTLLEHTTTIQEALTQ